MTADPWGVTGTEPEQRWHDRESRIGRIGRVLFPPSAIEPDWDSLSDEERDWVSETSTKIMDEIYPQVETADELDALPMGTVVISGSLVYRREHQGIGRRSGIDVGTRYVWRLAFSDSHKPVLHDSATLAAVGPWTVVRQQVAS